MGLLDLKTDLKSLKYGNDQRGGGSSNQPYIVTPIPDGYADIASDFLLRNGRLNPISAAQDVSRLTKLFSDTKSPNGLLFIAKQELLERQNVEIPGGFGRIYNPAGTLAQAGVLSGGYHLNKQGLNPFQQGYFNGGENGYYQTTLNDNEASINRLYGLYKLKQIASSNNIPENSLLSSIYNINIDSESPNMISYSGGPGSILGVGKTNIRFAGSGYRERTNNEIVTKDALNLIKKGNIPTTTTIDTIELPFFAGGNVDVVIPNILDIDKVIEQTSPVKNGGSTTLLTLNNTYNPRISNNGIGIVGNFNREVTYKTGNTTYKLDRSQNPNTSYNSDEINKSRILTLADDTLSTIKNQDLIKFYFEIINNDSILFDSNFLFFRAYLNNLGDNFKAEWQSYKYVGRAENFYKYGGFSRDISLSFTIYAHSRAEMIPIYEKLNYLAGTTAPSYSGAGLMRGNLIKLTVGDYLIDVPGIIQSINLKPSFEAGWDINRKEDGGLFDPNTKEDTDDTNGTKFVGQLPRLIEIDLSFTPIHTFTPQIGQDFIRNINQSPPINTNSTTETPTQDGLPG